MYTVNKDEKLLASKLQKEIKEIQRIERLEQAYKKWSNDDSMTQKYLDSKQTIITESNDKSKLVLVQAFFYVPEDDSNSLIGGIIDESNEKKFDLDSFKDLTLYQQENIDTLPFVKIIWSDFPEYKTGEIYGVKDKLAYIEHNPAYTEWWTRRANQPTLEDKEPQPGRFRMGWDDWTQMKYRINKFAKYVTLDDEFVFLVPTVVLITKSSI